MREGEGPDHVASVFDLLDEDDDGFASTELILPTYTPASRTSAVWAVVVLVTACVGAYLMLEGVVLGIVLPVGAVALGAAMVASEPGPARVPGPSSILRFSRKGVQVDGRLLKGLSRYELETTVVRLYCSGEETVVHTSLDPALRERLETALQTVLRLEALNRGGVPASLSALRDRQ